MTEHDQPCFLVKRNHEITQSDLNKPFSFNMVKHILRWKTKHCQYLGHAVKTVTKMQGGEERKKIVEHSMIDKVLRISQQILLHAEL